FIVVLSSLLPLSHRSLTGHFLLLVTIRASQRPTLFPYTTLFRSQPGAGHRPLALPIGRAGPGRGSPLLSAERAPPPRRPTVRTRSEEHTSELQSPDHLVCRLLLEKKKKKHLNTTQITFFNTSG